MTTNAITPSRARFGRAPEIRPPAMAPVSDVGAIQANSRQLIRPAQAWAAAAVVAATPEITRFAPAPAAGDEASRTTSGRRRFPSTSPTSPPAAETANDQRASAINSSVSTPGSYWIGDGAAVRHRPDASSRKRRPAGGGAPAGPD